LITQHVNENTAIGRAAVGHQGARVLRRDKDRTKTQEDRHIELCPRALEVLRRHLALRDEYAAAGKIRHQHLFFLEDGRPISDPEITRWRWSESIKALNIQRRGPYHARHSSVTWQLMLGKNLLWVAKQHGHSVEVMLRMYAAWLDGPLLSPLLAVDLAVALPLGGLQDRAPKRNGWVCCHEALAGVQIVLPGFVDNPEEPPALCFCVRQCEVNFQPLERNLMTRIVETNEYALCCSCHRRSALDERLIR